MSDKVAIITGGGSGIGKSSALALAHAGYAVAVAGRRPEPLDETVAAIGQAGGKGLAVQTDVGDPANVETLFAKVMETYGRLDLLFNNAGFGVAGLLEELTYEQWKSVVDTNLTGTFLCTQQAFKIMKDQDPQGGRIINNGSVSAHVPRPNSAPYTSTKHAITGLTKASSLDGRKYNIAVGQIDIGNALVKRTQQTRDGGLLQPNGETVPEATMDVENVADAIVQMAALDLGVNIQFITIMATKMPYIGRG